MFQVADRMKAMPFSGIRVMMEKANKMQSEGIDVIHMEIGRPDFDTPQVIKDAAYKSLSAGHVFYTSNYGTPALRKAIAEKLSKENNIPCDPSEVLVTVGVGEATYCACGCFLSEGDEVLIPNPVWLNYIHVPEFFGAKAVSYDLKEENDYQIDLNEIAGKITDRTKMIVLVTPNNPTGSVLHEGTLKGIADLAVKHNLIVLSDEIYEKLVYDGEKHISIASLPGMKERTVTLNGFSKCYSMTGWRLGYMAAPKEIIDAAVRLHQHINTCAASFVQDAGITALKEAEPDVQKMVAEYQRRRDYVVNSINGSPFLSCKVPKGAFYIFVNIKKTGEKAAAFSEYLLEHAHVATVPGTAFGSAGEGYVRLSYANSYENLVEACKRIHAAVNDMMME